MKANKFYDGSFILSKLEGHSFFFSLGNRGAGKSFFYKTFLIKQHLKAKEEGRWDNKFAIMFREVNTISLCANGFFDDVMRIKFPGHTMKFKYHRAEGYGEYFLDDNEESCGFALNLKHFQKYKLMTARLQPISWILQDEFLSENNQYLSNEIDAVMSIFQTVNRGGGDGNATRDLKWFFVANTVSIHNPYFNADIFSDIKKCMKQNTKKIVRDSYVFELIYKEQVREELMATSFGQLIANTEYGTYALENSWYNDNYKFVEKLDGQKDYVITLLIAKQKFAVYECRDKGLIYISKKVDNTHTICCLDNDDHDVNYIMIQKNENFLKNIVRLYKLGAVRFEDLDCKIAFLTITQIIKATESC